MENQVVVHKITAKPVVTQVKLLATHPIHSSARTGCERVAYETRDRAYEIVAVAGHLPRSCDVPTFWAILGMLQTEQDADPSVDTINVEIDDVIDAVGKSRQTGNRRSVIEAIERYQEMRVEITHKNKRVGNGYVRDKFALFSARIYGEKAVSITFDRLYLERLSDASAEEKRYLALEQVVRLSGVASQLYALLVGTMSRDGRYTAPVRQLARKLLGEDRGGNRRALPVSRFFSPYLTSAIAEIAGKTGWKISCVKDGRGETSTVTFTTAHLPAEMGDGYVPDANRIAYGKNDKPAAAAKPTTAPAKHEARAEASPAPTLSPAVLSALPPEAAENNLVVTALASVTESQALSVINYVNSKRPNSFVAYLTGTLNNRSIKSLVAEIGTANKNATADLEANYKYVIDTLNACNHDLFMDVCKHRGVDPDTAIAWAKERNLLANNAE